MRISERSRTRGGFTLTELMITVSLIGVLSAIAIPNFMSYQARTRRSEGFTHVAGIARAYKVYHAEQGRFPDTSRDAGFVSLPNTAALSTAKLPWDVDTENFFKIVGWRPDGDVYYTYEVESVDGCGGGCTDQACFTITAHGNVDNDGFPGAIMLVHPLRNAAGNPIAGATCSNFLGYGTPLQPGTGSPLYEEPAVYLNADLY